MPTSELAAALAAVQKDLPSITKGETAEVKHKDTGKKLYDYKYADLADVSEAILPLLGKNGLAFTAWPTLDDGQFVLAYALIHESGEERGGVYPLPSSGRPQDIGSAITYARRYCLCAVTGVAPGGEDDDDAGAQQEVHMDRARPQARPPSDVPSRPVVHGPRPGPELEQLRHGAVEATPSDRPAQRAKRPAEQDEWTDQPATVNPVVKARSKAIIMQFNHLEVTDREERLGITAKLAGWPEGKTLNSTNDLSKAQSDRVMAQLSDLTDHEALMALVTKGEKQDA